MSSHRYLGASFEVWPQQQTWLWFVVTPLGGGTIGAAATEAQAITDACSSIEEASAAERCGQIEQAAVRWNRSLASLACYLRARCASA